MPKDNFIYFPMKDSIGADEWRRIDIFKERATEYIETLKRLKLGMIHGSFRRHNDGTYSGSLQSPPMHSLKGLYVEFRLLYATGEPSNFRNIANIVARRSGNEMVKKFIKHLVRQARSSLVEDGFFQIDGRPMSGEKIIDLWFNAKIFHSDEQKRKELDRLITLLSNDGIKGLFFMAVYDAGLAVKNLYNIIKDIQPSNMSVPVPASFIDELNNASV